MFIKEVYWKWIHADINSATIQLLNVVILERLSIDGISLTKGAT